MLATAMGGTPQQAAAARKAYEAALEAWTLRMELAKTPEQQAAAMADRPDPKAAAERMWRIISPDLKREWVIAPAAYFLELAAMSKPAGTEGLAKPPMAEQMQAVRDAIARHHLTSPELAPMCMALVVAGDPASLALLRKIEAENPSAQVRGVAAMGIALVLKGMGDDPKLMRERLTMLRKAIIDAADVQVGQTTVANLAEEELYQIINLGKGQVAPELDGVDSGGRPMKLSETDGKVRLLVFWSAAGEAGERVAEMVRAMKADAKFAREDFEVIGVNADPVSVLREAQADGSVAWPNFSDPEGKLAEVYRVAAPPVAFVLGRDRKIHYIGSMGTFAELTAAAVLEGD